MSTSRRTSIARALDRGSTWAVPPIANIEIVSPVHGHLTDHLTGVDPGVLRHAPNGPILRSSFLNEWGWYGIHAFVFHHWGVKKSLFLLHFQYRVDASPDEVVTPQSWLNQPERFELRDDETHAGRCVRIYAFFTPRARSDSATLQTIDARLAAPWWLSRVWRRPPSWYGSGREYPGSRSTWVARTGARPPWLLAHTLPPMDSVWPDLRPPFRFGELPLEIQELVCEALFSSVFEGLERASGKEDWPVDRYLRHTPAILLVSRDVRDRALSALHRQPLRLQKGPPRARLTAVVRSIRHLISPTLLGNLRFIDLSYAGPARPTPLCNFLSMSVDVVRIWTERRVADGRRPGGPLSSVFKVEFAMDGVGDTVRWADVRKRADDLAEACAELVKKVAAPVKVEIGPNASKWNPRLWVEGVDMGARLPEAPWLYYSSDSSEPGDWDSLWASSAGPPVDSD